MLPMKELLLLLLVALLSGCATQSPPAHFYVLSAKAQTAQAAHPGLVVGIGPVSIADYLDRNQIVRRDTDVQLQMDEFNRWAGDHRKNITTVLADNLSRILGSEAVLPYPWASTLDLDYQIVVDVSRFDATSENRVVLDVQWQLFDGRTNKLLNVRRSHIETTVANNSHAAQVEAQNQALVSLGQILAKSLVSMTTGG